MDKTCLLFPHLQIQLRFKRVYPVNKLPYPGDPRCECDTCHNKWIMSLLPLRSR